MRVEVYNGAKDAMKSNADLSSVGERVILPSSFTGGERYMHQQSLDSIVLYQTFGHPHLFITMTTNPDWHEITAHLKNGETALDRPELVPRVFNAKNSNLSRTLKRT